MSRRSAVPLTAATLALTGLALGTGFVSPAAAATRSVPRSTARRTVPPTPVRAPACDAIDGRTLLQSDRWRIFRKLPADADANAFGVFACRRVVGPARRVLHLAQNVDEVDFYGLVPVQLQGDRLLANQESIARSGSDAQLEIFDLAHGRVAPVGPRGVNDGGYTPTFWPWGYLAPDGGIVIGEDFSTKDAIAGATLVYDAQGAGRAEQIGRIHEPSLGDATRAPGLYLMDAESGTTNAFRIVPTGAPTLAWKPLTLAAPRHLRTSVFRTIWAGASAQDQDLTTLDLEPPRPGGRAWHLVNRDGQTHGAVATLAEPDVRVLAANANDAVIRGWFRVGSRIVERVRVVPVTAGGKHAPAPLVDLPASAIPATPGSVALDEWGALVVAGRTALQVYDPGRRELPAIGAHDLAGTGNGVYWTDRAGLPHWTMVTKR